MANKELECPCCGGTLHFDSHSQDIVCPFCDSHFSLDDLKAYTDDLATDKEEDTAWDESKVQAYTDKEMKGMKIYSCESCGGEIKSEKHCTQDGGDQLKNEKAHDYSSLASSAFRAISCSSLLCVSEKSTNHTR